jgi:carboxyl-terminal processing protease
MRILLILLFMVASQVFWTGCSNPASPDFRSRDGLDEYADVWSWLRIFYIFQEELSSDPFAFTDPAKLCNSTSDPWTYYVSPDLSAGHQALFEPGYEPDLGISLQLRNGRYLIIYIVPQSPASSSLNKGDTLINIDGHAIDSATRRNDIAAWTIGDPGTVANLKVLRPKVPGPGSDTVSAQMTRRPYVHPTSLADTLGGNIGYVALYEFMDTSYFSDGTIFWGTYAEILPLLGRTASFPVLILDLRGDPGGYISTCVQIGGEFLHNGDTIVESRMRVDKDPGIGVTLDSSLVAKGGGGQANRKIVLLMDDSTASAAEMLISGIMHNNPNAFAMGTHTFGKARGQYLIPTLIGGLVRVTNMTMKTPSGADYNHSGILPDTMMNNVDKGRWLDAAYLRALDMAGIAHKMSAQGIREVSDHIQDIELNRKLIGGRRTEKIPVFRRPGR